MNVPARLTIIIAVLALLTPALRADFFQETWQEETVGDQLNQLVNWYTAYALAFPNAGSIVDAGSGDLQLRLAPVAPQNHTAVTSYYNIARLTTLNITGVVTMLNAPANGSFWLGFNSATNKGDGYLLGVNDNANQVFIRKMSNGTETTSLTLNGFDPGSSARTYVFSANFGTPGQITLNAYADGVQIITNWTDASVPANRIAAKVHIACWARNTQQAQFGDITAGSVIPEPVLALVPAVLALGIVRRRA